MQPKISLTSDLHYLRASLGIGPRASSGSGDTLAVAKGAKVKLSSLQPAEWVPDKAAAFGALAWEMIGTNWMAPTLSLFLNDPPPHSGDL